MQSRIVRTRHDTTTPARLLSVTKYPFPGRAPWLVERGNDGRLPLVRAIYRLDPPLKGWLDVTAGHHWRLGPGSGHPWSVGPEWPSANNRGANKGLTHYTIVGSLSFLYSIPPSCVTCSSAQAPSGGEIEWATFLITIQTREKSHGFRFQTGFNGFTYRSLNKIGKIIKMNGKTALSTQI